MQKGYCADLTDDEALMKAAKSMYPQFGEILMKDGRLYGLPVDANAYTYSVNMNAWEALGLNGGRSAQEPAGSDGVHRQLGL